MITEEKKKHIESLSDEEMSYEINLGRRSRFQRESFAYLQTCYQQRLSEKEEHYAMMRTFHKVPLAHELEVMTDFDLAELQTQLAPDSPGKIVVENEWQRRNSSKIPNLAANPIDKNLKLQNLITEIENQNVNFDSDSWPQFQQICVEWGDKVAPFLNPEEKNKFNRELDSIRAAIHEPYLPSDFSGAPKENAFNRMKGIAKQKLQELELESISIKVTDTATIPDFEWYGRISKEKGVTSRCPFATVEVCPRYFKAFHFCLKPDLLEFQIKKMQSF